MLHQIERLPACIITAQWRHVKKHTLYGDKPNEYNALEYQKHIYTGGTLIAMYIE